MPIRKHVVSGSSGVDQPRQDSGALIHVIRAVIRRPASDQAPDGVISDAPDRISGRRTEIKAVSGGVISRVIKHGQGVLARIKRKWWAINLRKCEFLGRCFCVGVNCRGANQELMIFAPHAAANYRRLRSFSSDRDDADYRRASANPEAAAAANPAADLLIPRPNPAANPDSNDTVVINIGIVGDSDTGKTSFMVKSTALCCP
jgi:hypothetical protein